MKDKKVVIGILLAVLIAGSVGAFIFSKRQKEEPKQEIVQEQPKQEAPKVEEKKVEGYSAQVEYLQGQVEKREGESYGWKNAEKGMVLKNGMEIRTFADAKVVLTFEDGSIARLDENTQVKLISEEKKITLEMPSGFVFNRVSKSDSREYVVKTGEYSMKALGTVFSVSKQKEGEPELMVLESEVEVRKGTGEKLDSAKMGEKIAIVKSKSEKKKLVKKDIEGEFVAWGIKEDKIKTDFLGTTSTEESTTSKIILTGKASEDGVKLSWQTSGISGFEGFKVVKSGEVNPVYPGNDYKYLEKSSTASYLWEISGGQKYHFRVCAYMGGKCKLYSNDVYVEAPEKDSSDDGDYASSVSLSKVEDDGDIYLKWTISGGDAPNGYKVVKSKDKNPEYPDDGYYKYISDEDTKKVKLEGFDSDDTYHFRVCIYKGGSCGAYSNDVEVSF